MQKTWHNRLDEALTARGKAWDDLVRVTGRKKPSVYGWKPTATKRSEMMDGHNAAKVCAFLDISPMWLFHDQGASGLITDYATNHTVTQLHAAEPDADETTLINAFRIGDTTARNMLLAQANAIITQAAQNTEQSLAVRLMSADAIAQQYPNEAKSTAPLRAQLQAAIDRQKKQELARIAAEKRKRGVTIGMSKDDALASNWGKPERIYKTHTARGIKEQWSYGGQSYLYFDDGVLTTIQN